MNKYRKKPVVIEAKQYTGTRGSYLNALGIDGVTANDEGVLQIETLEGVMTVSKGDYIIRGVKGELYPCKPDIFEATYERVDDEDRAEDGSDD